MGETMTAGRDLDALVAEKVMGWVRTPSEERARAARLGGRLMVFRDEWLAVGLCTEPADRERAEAGVAAVYRAAGLEPPRIVWMLPRWADAVPAYSTEIAAAWQVVEKMMERGWYLFLDTAGFDGEEWRAQFRDPESRFARGEAATAPLAICRAALAALSG